MLRRPRRPAAAPGVAARAAAWAALSVALVAVACAGGYLNRVRGGLGDVDPDARLGHDVTKRMAMALPSGLLAGTLTGNWLAGAYAWGASQATEMIGWGSYFSVGRHEGCGGRVGVYDWLLGEQGCDWPYGRRWMRGVTGMSIRGLQWTVPSGVLVWFFGYGWQPALSGVLMGPVYDLAFRLPAGGPLSAYGRDFRPGTPLAELIWGAWLFGVLALSCGVHAHRQPGLAEPRRDPRAGPARRALLAAALVLYDLVSAVSVAVYAGASDPDRRNWRETEAGLGVALAAAALPQLALAAVMAAAARHARASGSGEAAALLEGDDAGGAAARRAFPGLYAAYERTWCCGYSTRERRAASEAAREAAEEERDRGRRSAMARLAAGGPASPGARARTSVVSEEELGVARRRGACARLADWLVPALDRGTLPWWSPAPLWRPLLALVSAVIGAAALALLPAVGYCFVVLRGS